MTIVPQDETRIYLEFLEAVRDFNQANVTYLGEMHRLAQESQTALRQAGREHLNPLLSKLRTAQVISGAITAFSSIAFCSLVNNINSFPNAECLVFLSLLVIIISIVVFAWVSPRISAIVARTAQIQSEVRTENRS